MDPKRFYKSADQTKFPKYFQFGTVVEGPSEFYSGTIPSGSPYLCHVPAQQEIRHCFVAHVNCCFNAQDACSHLEKQCKHP